MDNKKVSDHHAIISTAELKICQAEELAKGEQDILSLIAARLLMATAQKQVYTEAELVVLCVGERFAAKWKAVREHGWRAVEAAFLQLQGLKNRGNAETGMPCSIAEGAVIEHVSADMTEHFTSPPKPYSEDTLLSAMETAGNKEFDGDTEKKGLGTPATRAGIIEKLVSSGYVIRKGSLKVMRSCRI